ncbi:MAG: M15 family metallopeptidase [Chloroflexota bacterium]
MDETISVADPRVAAVAMEECGEPIHDARDRPELLIDTRKQNDNEVFTHLRAGVLNRLLEAQSLLPEGLRFLLVEGHRPVTLQRIYFERYAQQLWRANPGWDADTLRTATSRHVAPPEIAPHGTGGAVDITLADADGIELDLGTRMNATPEESDDGCYTAASNISVEGRRNREILSAALSAAGFVNYPTEWWHWSYGDRYWALVTGQPAIYSVRDPDPSTS